MRFMRTAQNTEPAAPTQTRSDAYDGAVPVRRHSAGRVKRMPPQQFTAQDCAKIDNLFVPSDYTSFGLATMMPAFVR